MWEILAGILGFGFGSGTFPIPLAGNLQNEVEYYSNLLWPNTLLDLNTLYIAKLRGAITDDDFILYALEMGYNAKQIYAYMTAQKQIIDIATAVRLDLTKQINPDDIPDILAQNDIDQDVYDKIVKASQWWPSPMTMQDWLNKDIFNPETVKKYALDSYYNDDKTIHDRFAETGVPEKWNKYIWYASWNYPGYYEGKYMYDWWRAHPDNDPKLNPDRLKFDLSDFEYLMRVSNYPVYFQKLYTKILSNPLTYREIAELYHYEIIDEKEMKRLLAWSGYNDEQIDLLVKLFKVMYAPEGHKTAKSYTMSVIEQLYIHNKISRNDFENYMKELGYTDEAVKLYTQYIDLKLELEQEKETITEIEYQLKEHEITQEEALNKLINAGVDRDYAKYLTTIWNARYTHRHKAFPLTDLIKLASVKAVSEEDFVEELKADGYNNKQIEWLKIMAGLKPLPKTK